MSRERMDRAAPTVVSRGMIVLVLLTLAWTSSAPAQRTTTSVDACSAPSDCVLTHATCCGACGSAQRGDAMAVRPERLTGLHPGCDPLTATCPACDAPDDPDLTATCSERRCAVLDLAALPAQGALAGCTITLDGAETWASAELVPSPDLPALSPAGTAVHVRVVCDASAPTARLRVSGWLTAERRTERIDAPAVLDERSGTATDLVIGPGRSLSLRVQLGDGRVLPEGTAVRAALHWGGPGGTLDLAAPPTVVRVAS